MIEELDVVRLTEDIPSLRLLAGMRGTVVAIYGDHDVYYVEFVDDAGYTIALTELRPNQVELVWRVATHADVDAVKPATRESLEPVSILGYTLDQASRLSGLSRRQLQSWANSGFLKPSVESARDRRFGRIYSFKDIVGLRTLAVLRIVHRVPPGDLRKVSEQFAAWPEKGWHNVQLWVRGRRVYFENPVSGQVHAGKQPPQTTMVIELDRIAADVRSELERLQQRRSGQIGKLERHRNVAANKMLISGTRISTEAIQKFRKAGYSNQEILAEFPALTEQDIEAALDFEEQRHRTIAS